MAPTLFKERVVWGKRYAKESHYSTISPGGSTDRSRTGWKLSPRLRPSRSSRQTTRVSPLLHISGKPQVPAELSSCASMFLVDLSALPTLKSVALQQG